MANVTQKAIEISAYIAEALALRLPALTQSTSFDTDGNPLISIGDGVSTHANAIIKVMPLPWALAKDALGNTALQYTPHVIRLATEAPASGSGAGVYLSLPQLLPIMGELLGRSQIRVEWWQETNGTPPAATTFNTAAKQIAAFEANAQYPMIQSQ